MRGADCIASAGEIKGPRVLKVCWKKHDCNRRGIGCNLKGVPELPDIAAYLTALEPRVIGHPILRVRLASPFLLRTAQPPLSNVEGRSVRELRRIGKRIAMGVEGELWLVLHLMIAGRLHWRPPNAKLAGRQMLAAFDFVKRRVLAALDRSLDRALVTDDRQSKATAGAALWW